jgi:hypothetical protein
MGNRGKSLEIHQNDRKCREKVYFRHSNGFQCPSPVNANIVRDQPRMDLPVCASSLGATQIPVKINRAVASEAELVTAQLDDGMPLSLALAQRYSRAQRTKRLAMRETVRRISKLRPQISLSTLKIFPKVSANSDLCLFSGVLGDPNQFDQTVRTLIRPKLEIPSQNDRFQRTPFDLTGTDGAEFNASETPPESKTIDLD